MSKRTPRISKPRANAAPIDQFRQKKNKAKSANSPPSVMDRIPIEIIDHIFEKYVEMDQSSCKLAFVSKLWGSLALGNPRLWTHIDIESRNGYAGYIVEEWSILGVAGAIYTGGRKQVCEREDEFVAAVDRAGSLPITLSYLNHPELSEADRSSILRRILTPPICSRLYKLELRDLRYSIPDFLKNEALGPFSALCDVSLAVSNVEWLQTQLRDLNQTAPILKSVEIMARLDESVRLYPIWKKLHVLKFKASPISFHTANAILSQSTQLTEFSSPYSTWTTKFPDFSSLSNLTTATLRCDFRQLSRLKFPQLQSLDLTDTSKTISPTSYSLRLPQLITLRIRMRFTSIILRHLEMPSLKTLYITHCCHDDVEQFFPSSGYPEVTDFCLESTQEKNTFLAATMAAPNAQRVQLISTKSLGTQILDRLAVADEGIAWPRLQRFILGHRDYPIKARKLTLDDSIRDIMAFREEMGLEYAWFDIYYQGRSSEEIELIQYK